MPELCSNTSDTTLAPGVMAPPEDARRVIGARVCTIVVFEAALTACARRFGSAASSKYVEGWFTRSLLSTQKAVRKSESKVGYSLRCKHKRVLLSNIKAADPSSVSPLIDRAPVQDVQTSSDGEEATFGKAGALAYSYAPSGP
jgi:hypothetical protein